MAAVRKRDLIVRTLRQLQESMPADASDTRYACQKLLDKVAYTAPELMDYLWLRIYRHLQTCVPWDGSTEIWNQANNKYKEIT